MTTTAKISDIEKLMRERAKDYPGIKVNHVPKAPDTFDGPHMGDRIVKANPNAKPTDPVVKDDEDADTSEFVHPLADPNNDMDRYIKPSEYLKHNIIPQMDQIYLIDYNLALDIRGDAVAIENDKPEYCFKFTRFGNISKIELVSAIISNHHHISDEPYLFLSIKEFEGRCHLANGKRTFGKIMMVNNKEPVEEQSQLIYIPEECVQSFSKPICLETLTVSICDGQGTPINLREIRVEKVLKSKSGNELVIECAHPHHLQERDKIEMHVIKRSHIDSYEVDVRSVIDNRKFRIKGNFDTLTQQMRIFRTNIVLALTFKFYEINWFVLNDSSFQTVQLVRLSEMIKEKNKSIEN